MDVLLEQAVKLECEKESVQSIVKRLGNPVSVIMLNSGCRDFQVPGIDGFIGYQVVRNCAVVMGDPVCLPENQEQLVQAFHLYCKSNGLKIIYFLTSETFSRWAINKKCKSLIQISKEVVLNPKTFQIKHKLRWKINRSIQLGVQVKECEDLEDSLEAQIKNTINDWLKTKQDSRIYLGNIFSLEGKRIFYAVKDDKIVGLLTLGRIDQFQGWVVTAFFAIPEAPAGVTEHLIGTVIEALSSEGCEYLCLGIVSGSGLGETVGLNRFSKFFVNAIFRILRWFFPLDSRMKYYVKFHPELCPLHVLFDGKFSLNELIALKKILSVKL